MPLWNQPSKDKVDQCVTIASYFKSKAPATAVNGKKDTKPTQTKLSQELMQPAIKNLKLM